MHHFHLINKRHLAVFALLAASGVTFWLPLRGTAQSGMSDPGVPPASYDNNSNNNNNSSSNNNNNSSSSNNNNGDGSGEFNPNGTDGDSAIGPSGEPVQNPPVGVDILGHTDAAATRNGRTTRRKEPAPSNPIVIPEPLPGTIPIKLPTSPSKAPGNYTVSTDPTTFGSRRFQKPLPLFGYDFFQPARQIIIARRRAFLPTLRPPTRQTSPILPNRTRSLPRTSNPQTGAGAIAGTPGFGNGAQTDQYGQTLPGSPADRGGMIGPVDQYGTASPDSQYGTGSQPDQYGTNSAADQSGMDGQTDQYGASGQTDRRGLESQTDQPSMSDQGGTGNQPGQYGGNSQTDQYDTDHYDTGSQTDQGSQSNSYGATDQSDQTDQYGTGGSARPGRTSIPSAPRGPYPRPNAPYQSPDGFSGDTQTPNGDIQFPGDDALLPGNATDTLSGQIADPIATLYRNTLTSLPSNYQLQPGDTLTIRYSALTVAPREVVAVVNIQGGVSVPEVGQITMVGRTLPQAEAALRQRLERLYRDVSVSITLQQIRTIQVTISGAAFSPGTYNVPATATAFNILNAAGGPTANGSLRDIRILRNGRRVGTLDIYPLIGATSGSPTSRNGDIGLQAGDNIYIPARLSRITVRGEVRQEAIYELTPTETLQDAISYAGGVKASGVDQNIHIDTVVRGTDRVIVDVNLRDRAQVAATRLYDGDSVEVSSVRAILTNRVTVEGEVDQPGDYALFPGMRVLDLIQRARGTRYDTYLDKATLVRQNADNTTTLISLNIGKVIDGDPTQNIAMKRFDRLRVYSLQEAAYLGQRTVTVRGAVQRPGLYTQSDNMHVSDLLLATGGPLLDAYLNRAVLLHQRGDGTFAYDYVNLRAISDGDTTQDMPIQDQDILAVYRVGEAHFTPDHTVKILGDVVAPGLYARGEGMRLSDLLKLAGSFKPGGGTRVTIAHARRSITDPVTQVAPVTVALDPQGATAMDTDLTLQDGDVVAVQGDGTLRDHPAVVTVTGKVNRPGPIILTQNMRLSEAIAKAGGLTPEAFPQGAEFTRMTDALITSGQSNLANIINQMSQLLNLSEYQRERAKANLELIEAAGTASSGSSALPIPGLSSGGSSANPNLAPLIGTLSQNNPVTPGRLLTPSQLQPNGSVAVRLTDAIRHPGGAQDILLKDGDTLVVPETPTTVQVVGAVIGARGVLFKQGESIDYYIQNAGGFTPDAARDRIQVIHAGGGLIPAGKAGALQPGDLILVPTKVLAEKISRGGNDISSLFQALVGSAITYKVLSSLF